MRPHIPNDARTRMLAHARSVASTELGQPTIPEQCEPFSVNGEFGGLFVTLWNDEQLRGCIGEFAEVIDVWPLVAPVTRSALRDSRFAANPITLQELAKVTFELSVLSRFERTNEPLSLVPGRHGIVIRSGNRSGCFLPRVATDRGWSAETFLSKCCVMKAGLPASAWKDGTANVMLFTAESFSDEDDESRVGRG